MSHSLTCLRKEWCLADTYYHEGENGSQEWIAPKDVIIEKTAKGKITSIKDQSGREVIGSGMSKMSKSKNNGVDPQQLIEKYGADTLRVFSMFAAPPDQSMEWSDSGVEGANRFIKRLWRQVYVHLENRPLEDLDTDSLKDVQLEMRRKTYSTLEKVSDDMATSFYLQYGYCSQYGITK